MITLSNMKYALHATPTGERRNLYRKRGLRHNWEDNRWRKCIANGGDYAEK
jgi:hypothetical protein